MKPAASATNSCSFFFFPTAPLTQFVEVEEDELDIPMEELFAPQPAGETAVDEDGEVRVLYTQPHIQTC